jgi:predicted nucleic acid-binding protein
LIVVCDTSPILNLARIGRLELLPLLYRRVLIPAAVYRELKGTCAICLRYRLRFGNRSCSSRRPKNRGRVRERGEHLDPVEAEAMVLAIERRADLLLVDERRGRRTAVAAGLTVMGLLGGLARAKRAGLIDLVKPVLDELIQTARFWIGPDLYPEVLRELGEE